MKTFLFVIALALMSCGPQFDREEMQGVKDQFCGEVLRAAEAAQKRGLELTPNEKAALEFCR